MRDWTVFEVREFNLCLSQSRKLCESCNLRKVNSVNSHMTLKVESFPAILWGKYNVSNTLIQHAGPTAET